ncbi:hypothetical protein A6S26_17080 [Nostoc sp. ATCC 43529]|nr:hypothetical protein A6S26_17080 [Nostoc sp. ATCC 43529]
MFRILVAFGSNDLKSVRRDSLLLGILFAPWLFVIPVRLLVPSLTDLLMTRYNFNLVNFYELILSFVFLLNIPLLFGVLMGFLVLDERDENTLTALRVTPISVMGFVTYRVLMATLISILYNLICLPLTGLIPMSVFPEIVPVTLVASLFAPVLSLFLVSFANNKVEGLAFAKGLGVLVVGPLVSYFVNSQWQLMFGILPTYWSAKAFWLAVNGQPYLFYLLGGLVYHLLLLFWFLNRFQKKVQD